MEISSASIYDYIAINSSIRVLYKDRYKCSDELNKLRARMKKYRPEMIEDRILQRKAAKGCGVVVGHTVDRIDNIQFNTCLCEIKHPLTNKLLRLSDLLEKGILPYSGAALDQPAQIMELLDIVDNAKLREKNEQTKELNNGRRKH